MDGGYMMMNGNMHSRQTQQVHHPLDHSFRPLFFILSSTLIYSYLRLISLSISTTPLLLFLPASFFCLGMGSLEKSYPCSGCAFCLSCLLPNRCCLTMFFLFIFFPLSQGVEGSSSSALMWTIQRGGSPKKGMVNEVQPMFSLGGSSRRCCMLLRYYWLVLMVLLPCQKKGLSLGSGCVQGYAGSYSNVTPERHFLQGILVDLWMMHLGEGGKRIFSVLTISRAGSYYLISILSSSSMVDALSTALTPSLIPLAPLLMLLTFHSEHSPSRMMIMSLISSSI